MKKHNRKEANARFTEMETDIFKFYAKIYKRIKMKIKLLFDIHGN